MMGLNATCVALGGLFFTFTGGMLVGAALSPYVVNYTSALFGSSTPVKFLLCGVLITLCGIVSAVIWQKAD